MSESSGVSGRTDISYDRFRKVTARRLTASVTEKPPVTLHRHAVLTAFDTSLAEAAARTGSPDLGMTSLLLNLIASAIGKHNRLNGWVQDRVITLLSNVDLGVAVDVGGTLAVPVVRNAHALSVTAIGRQLRELATAAREGRLRTEDIEGATFTVTSLGPLGVEFFTPIINPPQLAILGVGAVTDHLVLQDGVPRTERRIGLSLSFDHAATDGADAARVLSHLVTAIEDPRQVRWSDQDSVEDADAGLVRNSRTLA